MGELILRLREQFGEMFAQYDKLSGRIKPAESTDVVDNPVKREWAAQEGYRPGYNPNSDSVTWTKTPEPAYQQARTKNMQGSMSPERLVESFPAFAYKAANLDGHIQEVITQAMNGQITSQRAKEMMYQFALETFDEAWSEGKPEGAAKTAASFDEAMGNANKSNKVAG